MKVGQTQKLSVHDFKHDIISHCKTSSATNIFCSIRQQFMCALYMYQNFRRFRKRRILLLCMVGMSHILLQRVVGNAKDNHGVIVENSCLIAICLPESLCSQPGMYHSRFVTSLQLFWFMSETSFFKVSALEPPLALMTMVTRQIAMSSARRLRGVSTTPTTQLTLLV